MGRNIIRLCSHRLTDARVPGPEKAQRPINTFPDADARRNGNLKVGPLFPNTNGQLTFVQTLAIMLACNGERLGELSRAVGEAFYRAPPLAALIHLIQAAQWLKRANEHTAWRAFLVSHDVQAFVHTVDEVDVGVSRRAEQYFSAFGNSSRGVCRQIAESEVCFGFDNHAGSFAMDQDTAEKIARQLGGRTREEGQRNGCSFSKERRERQSILGRRRNAALRS